MEDHDAAEEARKKRLEEWNAAEEARQKRKEDWEAAEEARQKNLEDRTTAEEARLKRKAHLKAREEAFRKRREYKEAASRVYQLDLSREKAKIIADVRRDFKYTSSRMEEKYCVWPGDRCSWKDPSCGITWVAVCGENSICVVAERAPLWRDGVVAEPIDDDDVYKFMRAKSYEIEDASIFSSLGRTIVQPFAIVSAVRDMVPRRQITKVDEVSGEKVRVGEYRPFELAANLSFQYGPPSYYIMVQYSEAEAVAYLRSKMNSINSPLYIDETIQTAIHAFRLLSGELYLCRGSQPASGYGYLVIHNGRHRLTDYEIRRYVRAIEQQGGVQRGDFMMQRL